MIKKTMMCFAACTLAVAVWAGMVIDGTSWKATVAPDKDAAAAGVKAFDETLQFKDNQLTTTANGFSPAAYSTASTDSLDKKENGGAWIAKQTDAAGRSAEWRGQVEKHRMHGIYILTDAQGHQQRFVFKAHKV